MPSIECQSYFDQLRDYRERSSKRLRGDFALALHCATCIMRSMHKLSELDVRRLALQIAARAVVDPRTAIRFLRGEAVRGHAGARIGIAVEELRAAGEIQA